MCHIFFHKRSFWSCPEILCGYCVCLLLSPCRTEGMILSTNQQTACVAQTCRDPFRLSVPQWSSTVRRERLNTAQSRSRPFLAVETLDRGQARRVSGNKSVTLHDSDAGILRPTEKCNPQGEMLDIFWNMHDFEA